jgi:protein-disulfide isomerase
MPRRYSPLLIALALLSGSSCSKPDPVETKAPVAAPTAEVTLKGIDTAMLTARERRELTGQLTELLAPCPEVPVNIAQCLAEQRPCKACKTAAQFLLKQVQAGKPRRDREESFHARFDPSKVKTLSVDNSPDVGSPDAPVTIIEWADFECPFCKNVGPVLEDVVRHFPGQVRLVFKFFPLSVHPHGELAARAAIAAQSQGKFWAMHHMLFDNAPKLEQADLERYARQLNLDLPKFRTDLSSQETTDRITREKKQAEELGLEGTPFIFINGRNLPTEILTSYDDLVEWVKLDIESAGLVPKVAAPKASASAGPGEAPAPSGSASAGKPPAPTEKK